MKLKRSGTKIKRYGNYLHPNRGLRRVLTAICALAGVAALAFIGWVVYPPVRDFLLTDRSEITAESHSEESKTSPAASAPEVSTSLAAESESASVSSEPSGTSGASAEESSVTAADIGTLKGVYMPGNVAANSSKMNTLLTSASAAGQNTVLVEAKDSSGVVFFTTENEIAADAGAVSASAYSAERIVKAITDAGMHPAAHVYAFRDPLVSAKNRDLAVHYGDSDMRWLDNAAESGGQSWLNPCDADAQEYIISLCVELTKAGFEEIMLDGVQFPSGYGTDKAGYGVSSFSRSEVLKSFVTALTKRVEAAGGSVTVCISAENIGEGKDEKTLASIDSKNRSLFGGDPEELVQGSGMIMLGTSSDRSAVKLFIENNSANTDWSVCVPAYGLDGAALSLADSLATFGTDSGYVLYNPTGSYKY